MDVLKKQALVGTARKAFSRVRSYWESTAAQPITDAVRIFKLVSQWPGQKLVTCPHPLLTQSILKISESVTRSKVSDLCLTRREAKYPPHIALAGALLVLTVQPCGEPCGSAAEFKLFDCESNSNIKETILLSAPESIPVVWSLFYTCKVPNLISLGCCKFFLKDGEIKEHLLSCFAEWKKRVEPCMDRLKTCARRQEKQGPDRASEATSLLPIWDLETWFVLLSLSLKSLLCSKCQTFIVHNFFFY